MSTGIILTSLGAFDDLGKAVRISADGSIIVGGTSWDSTDPNFALVRYTSAGQLDLTFGGGAGYVTTDLGFSDVGNAIALQGDGKILLTGSASNGSASNIALLRYTTAGALDPTFGGGAGVVTTPLSGGSVGNSVLVQTNGKILVAGDVNNGNNTSFALVRYNSDGSLDTSFGDDDGIVRTHLAGGNSAHAAVLQSDGKIILAGNSRNNNSVDWDDDFVLIRYRSNGDLDSSFGSSGVVNTRLAAVDVANGIAIQSDNKIVVVGKGQLNANTNSDFAVVRFTSSGALDSSFGGGKGYVTLDLGFDDAAQSVTVLSSGKILVGGWSSDGVHTRFALLEFNADGSLDTSFGNGTGKVTTIVGVSDAVEYGIAVQSDGKIVAVGQASDGLGGTDVALVRYNADGSLDTSFGKQSQASIAAADAVKAEGNSGTTAFTFTVTRTGDLSAAQSVSYGVTGSGPNPADATDFAGGILPSGTVTFAAGEASKTITILVSGDTTVEPDNGFTVTLSNASGGMTIGTASATGTILNDDKSVASIVATDAVKAEGNSGTTAFTFTVTLDQAAVSGQTIGWSVSGSGPNPANAADFAGGILPSGTVTFAAGEASKTITILVSGDTTVEPDNGFTVTLSNASGGMTIGTASATGTILNDDKSVASIVATDAVKAEGNSGTTAFTFTVTLDQAAVSGQTIGWSVSGSGPNPANAADFAGGILPSGTVTFAAGEASKTITILVSGDTTVEPDNGFTVTLSNASGGMTIGTASATGTILNDDKSVASIVATDAVKAEGNSGTTAFTFTVTLDQAAVSGQTIDWSVSGSGSNPANAADFAGGILPSGTVTFAAGETSKTITVLVSGDTTVEPDNGFTVTLSSPSAGLTIGTASATGTILNDDSPTVSIAAADAVKAEGNSGTTAFTFTLTLGQSALTTQTVDWSVSGSGPNPADATDFAGGILPSGTVTFAAGETSKTITVLVSGDTTVEPDNGFTVTLSSPSAGLTIGTASAIGTILNDDTAKVSIVATDAEKMEPSSGTVPFIFTVTLDQAAATSQSVDWSVTGTGFSPADASDFAGNLLPSGTVTFAAGETSKTVTVLVAGTTAVESDETFAVALSAPTSGLAILHGSATGIIHPFNSVDVGGNGSGVDGTGGGSSGGGPPPDGSIDIHNDAYTLLAGHSITADSAISVLINDSSQLPLSASLLTGPSNGTVQFHQDGSFIYTPTSSFFGVDSFTYSATNGTSAASAEVYLYVVPTLGGDVLDLLHLGPEAQVASIYTAFFGRGADKTGFAFWVNQFTANLPTLGPQALFASIASSFGVSDEAKGIYPFLANPSGASDAQIGSFLDTVYENLFNRHSDSDGLAYWTNQIKQTLAAGQFVGSVLIDIIGGAQNNSVGQDITTLVNKVAVALEYVQQQEQLGTSWSFAQDGASSIALLHAVTSDSVTVLVGVKQADTLILADAHRT